MSSEKKYSLISVDIADDEEVIRVGTPTSSPSLSEHKSVSGNLSESENPSSDSGEGFSESAAEAFVEPEQNRQKNTVSGNASKPIDESIQQTLEDLDAPVPFANMQKIVLVVLALVVVACAIYWFTTHGA